MKLHFDNKHCRSANVKKGKEKDNYTSTLLQGSQKKGWNTIKTSNIFKWFPNLIKPIVSSECLRSVAYFKRCRDFLFLFPSPSNSNGFSFYLKIYISPSYIK